MSFQIENKFIFEMTSEQDYYREEFITKTVEKTHGKYKVVIHNYDTAKLSGKNTW